MDVQFYSEAPPGCLNRIIKNFFVLEYAGEKNRNNYLLPDGFPTIFYVKTEKGIEVKFHGTPETSMVETGLYMSYTSTMAAFCHGKIQVVGVSCYPMSMAIFFKNGLREIHNTMTPLTVFDEDKPLIDPLKSSREIMNILADFLESKLKRTTFDDQISGVYQKLMGSNGYQHTVEDIAEWMKCSTRHLRELFQKHLGMSPKKFLQLVRFNHVLKYLDDSEGEVSLSQVAHLCGYHDQAHFITDFKKICGKSPKNFAEINSSLASRFRLF